MRAAKGFAGSTSQLSEFSHFTGLLSIRKTRSNTLNVSIRSIDDGSGAQKAEACCKRSTAFGISGSISEYSNLRSTLLSACFPDVNQYQ